MEKLKSWGVKCPEDYKTNQKFKEIIVKLNNKYGYAFGGGCLGYYYGINSDLKYDCDYNKRFDKILTIDEAHSMLFENYIIEKPILTPYQKLINAGFERREIDDTIYFDVHGYFPFVMVKKLDKRTKIVWNSVDNSIELMVSDVDGNIFFRKELDLEEVI